MNKRKIKTLQPIGRWGRLHLDYIKENQSDLLKNMLENNTLCNYLDSIDAEAQTQFEKRVEEWRIDSDGSPQSIKCIQLLAEERVLQEIIYKIPN